MSMLIFSCKHVILNASDRPPLVDQIPTEVPPMLQLDPTNSGGASMTDLEPAEESARALGDIPPPSPGPQTQMAELEEVTPVFTAQTIPEESSDMSGITQFLSTVAVSMDARSPRSSTVQEGAHNPASVEVEEDEGVARSGSVEHLHPVGRNRSKGADKGDPMLARRGSTAVLPPDNYGSRLTAAFSRYSHDSQLVVIALPKMRRRQGPVEYLDSLHTLIKDLDRVIMVQESGNEKVQLYG